MGYAAGAVETNMPSISSEPTMCIFWGSTLEMDLAEWQQELAKRWPEQLIKGLIQSDGCRSYSTSRSGWRQPRYAFSNVSTDITSIFCSACDCLGLCWTVSFPTNEAAAVSIYVSRKADVARLDEFVGPKR